jgi:hypothetical protein
MNFLKYFGIGLISTFIGMSLLGLFLGGSIISGIALMMMTPYFWTPVVFINSGILTYADYKANYCQSSSN